MFRCCSAIALMVMIVSQTMAQDRRPALMVLPFALEDSQGSRNWVAQAFQESLSTEAGRKQIAVVVAAPDRLAPPREAREALIVARENHADLVLYGTCKIDDQTIRLTAQLCDVATGQEIGKLRATGSIRAIIDLQEGVYQQLRGLVLDAPAVVAETPAPAAAPATEPAPAPATAPAPMQPEVAQADPGLSYPPSYDYSGSAAGGYGGYGYYPAYAPAYVYDPGYLYTPPCFSLYFGYCGGWFDRDEHGHHNHHGWRPSDAHTASTNAHPGRQDGVTTLKYGSAVHASPSHVDVVRSTPQIEASRMSGESSTFRASDSPRSFKTVPPSIRGDAARATPDPVRSPSVERDTARPAREVQPSPSRIASDSPRISSPPPSPSHDSSSAPRASSPPARESSPAPAPPSRAPASSSSSHGGGSSGRR